MRSLSAALLILLFLPASALARATATPPPGNSAVSQYLEVVPTVNGSRPSTAIGTSGAHGTGGAGTTSPLSPSVARALARRGASGRGVIALANATGVAARPSPGRVRRREPAMLSHRTGGRSARGTAPATALAGALTGSSDGLSPWLLPILIAIALGGGVMAAVRRRRRS
jgi:hypothetical protein